MKGRRRHIAVDTLGLILTLDVHAGSIQDRIEAKAVFIRLLKSFPGLHLIWADGGYRGKLVDWVKNFCGWTPEIVKRNYDLRTCLVKSALDFC
jgi:putative transposase